MKKAGFPREIRIKRESDFRRIIGEGSRRHSEHFLLFRLRVPEKQGQRLGIKMARGITPSAVRNRLKRAIREVLRKNRQKFASGESVVVVCKASAQGISPCRLREELQSLICRAKPSGLQLNSVPRDCPDGPDVGTGRT